jgi:hypothetical protein
MWEVLSHIETLHQGKSAARHHFGGVMNKYLSILIVLFFSLNACMPELREPIMDKRVTNEPSSSSKTATPQVNEAIPSSTAAPASSNLLRGNVYLDSTELLTMESFPLQFTLSLKGNLPTPCDQLQVDVHPPDLENKILVDVYSATQSDKICAQVLEPFEENFLLGSFPAGHYTLWVNGNQIAEFDA